MTANAVQAAACNALTTTCRRLSMLLALAFGTRVLAAIPSTLLSISTSIAETHEGFNEIGLRKARLSAMFDLLPVALAERLREGPERIVSHPTDQLEILRRQTVEVTTILPERYRNESRQFIQLEQTCLHGLRDLLALAQHHRETARRKVHFKIVRLAHRSASILALGCGSHAQLLLGLSRSQLASVTAVNQNHEELEEAVHKIVRAHVES